MIHTIVDFVSQWEHRSSATQSLLDALTDKALAQPVADGHRTLGRIAWHMVQTLPEMLGQTGLEPEGPGVDAPVPETATEVAEAYRAAAASLLEQIRSRWTDATLDEEDDLYGTKWKRSFTLGALIHHEIHHAGQLSVLMRQAGLPVTGAYGPAKEEWSKMGMEAPTI